MLYPRMTTAMTTTAPSPRAENANAQLLPALQVRADAVMVNFMQYFEDEWKCKTETCIQERGLRTKIAKKKSCLTMKMTIVRTVSLVSQNGKVQRDDEVRTEFPCLERTLIN